MFHPQFVCYLGIGMILSMQLLFCIYYCNNYNLGAYRYLQMIIVFVDITLATGQCFVRERFVASDRTFIMISTGIVADARAVCLYCALYTVIFVLDDFSFLYRLWAIKYPHLIQKFSQPSFVLFLVSLAMFESVTWFSMVYFAFVPSQTGREKVREQILTHFGVDAMERGMIMAELLNEDCTFNIRVLVGITIALIVIGSCISFMLYSFITIYVFLKKANIKSQASLRLQKQLFFTLCLQTLIPFFALYLSCGAFMILPMLDMDAGWVADLAPLLISYFLPLDALAVLLTMADYRREIVRLLGRKKYAPKHGLAMVSQMTTATRWTTEL